MSSKRKQPPARVPTLTEVVALQPLEPSLAGSPVELATGGAAEPSAHDLAERLAEELRSWVNSTAEQRLCEALPASVDTMIQDLLDQLHRDLDPTLREAVVLALVRGTGRGTETQR